MDQRIQIDPFRCQGEIARLDFFHVQHVTNQADQRLRGAVGQFDGVFRFFRALFTGGQ
ncbi:hypothetical protein D3C80_1922760 [compost metagenome]